MTVAVRDVGARDRLAERCRRVTGSRWFDPAILVVILLNAVALGLETYDSVDRAIGAVLHLANDAILGVFVVELLIRLGAHADRPASFWRSGWNVFDFVVVSASFVPGVRENGRPGSGCRTGRCSSTCPMSWWRRS